LRVAAPLTFAMRHLAAHLPEFLRAYPDITIDLIADVLMRRCALAACRIQA
jgi:DNA-binding transcriptional LysR family regulator